MFHIFSIHFWTSFGFGLKSCGPCKTCTFWMIISIFLNLFVNGRGIGWNDAALIGIQILQYHLLKGKICGVPFQLLIMLKLTSPLFSNIKLNCLFFFALKQLECVLLTTYCLVVHMKHQCNSKSYYKHKNCILFIYCSMHQQQLKL